MKIIVVATLATAFISSGALAQPYDHSRDRGNDMAHHDDGAHGDMGRHDNSDHGRMRWRDGDRHGHRGRVVCAWRHHHRVCYRPHW